MSVSTRVRDRRKELGLTQEQVARKADMSLNGIARLEQGQRTDPHVSTVRKLAHALDMSVCELLGEE